MSRYLVVGIGGFIGANARYIVSGWVQQKWGASFPYGTFIINVTGCFILGIFATLTQYFLWHENWRLLVAIGFVGAYTTFSTFEYETLQLVAQGTWPRAALNIIGSVLCGFAAAQLGVITARLLTRGHA